MSEMPDFWKDAHVISTYTRAQAIADGVLVDMMQDHCAGLVREAGIRYPLAMTVEAWYATIGLGGEWVTDPTGEHEIMILPAGQYANDRLWNMLTMLKLAARHSTGDRIDFKVAVYDGTRHVEVELWSHCGHGDKGEPVLTVMLQGQD